jgi:hypothetical protein
MVLIQSASAHADRTHDGIAVLERNAAGENDDLPAIGGLDSEQR